MTLQHLEHVLRAAADITGATEIVVIGSQAILGQIDDPPSELVSSIEADIFTLRAASDADVIDGAIGELSMFHQTFGYYAHGVSERTAILPDGWQQRLVRLHSASTGAATGLCLELHDLAVSKLIAARPKDVEFVGGLFRYRLADPDVVLERLMVTEVDDARRTLAETLLARLRV